MIEIAGGILLVLAIIVALPLILFGFAWILLAAAVIGGGTLLYHLHWSAPFIVLVVAVLYWLGTPPPEKKET